MAMPWSSAALDHLIVADRAAGLNHSRSAGLDAGQHAVGDGKERVGGDDGAFCERFGELQSAAASCALRAAMRAESTRLIWPAPMPTVARSLA